MGNVDEIVAPPVSKFAPPLARELLILWGELMES